MKIAASFLLGLFLTLPTLTKAVAEKPRGSQSSHSLSEENGAIHVEFQTDEVASKPSGKKACWKDSEPRGKGHLPDRETQQCPGTQEKSMGLCYPKCGEKRVGWGPLCLDNCQFTVYKTNAAFFCCDTDEICKDLMQDVAMKLPKAIVRMAIDIATNPSDARKIAQDFREFLADAMKLRLPMCSKMAFADSEMDQDREEESLSFEVWQTQEVFEDQTNSLDTREAMRSKDDFDSMPFKSSYATA